MLRSSGSSCVALLLTLGLAACNDSASPAPPGGGIGGAGGTIIRPPTGGSGGSGTGGTGTGGTGGTGTGGVGGDGGLGGAGGSVSRGACDNPLDILALTSLEPMDNARAVSARCAITTCSNLIGQDDAFRQCVTACVGRNIANLSIECAQCYGELGLCAGLTCNTRCEMDPCNEILCENCTIGGDYPQCFTDLNECAGRPSRDCGPV